MKDGCGCMEWPQEQDKPLDDAVVRGKRERQAVLKRVRQQRMKVLKAFKSIK